MVPGMEGLGKLCPPRQVILYPEELIEMAEIPSTPL